MKKACFTYDYTKCMMTKLGLSFPDRKGGSNVLCDFERALELIISADKLSLGVQKIVYLVGWQYNGHDDKYPAFFEVNEKLKRASDKCALDSLLWLIKEAKKYNTIVSLHINFTDAYENSPLFEEYRKAGALIRNLRRRPAQIEIYNGIPCYKISYKEEWESGLFKARIDRLLSIIPLEELGTVHVDNFQCYVNRSPRVNIAEMQHYRNLMIDYLAQKGIDITTEFTYREGKGTALLYGRITRDVTPTRYPIALLDKVPAVWWVDKLTIQEYFDYYPKPYCGGLPKDSRIYSMLYGNIHVEEIWGIENWQDEFLCQFCMINLPFFFLAQKDKKSFGKDNNSVIFTDGTESFIDGTIISDAQVVKTKDMIFLPFKNGYVAYSLINQQLSRSIEFEQVNLYEISKEGLISRGRLSVSNGIVSLSAEEKKAYYLTYKSGVE